MSNSEFQPRLIVIDDEEAIRDGVSQVFLRQGYQVETAVGGKEGLAMLEKEPFHVALLDLRMPDMSGAEVLQRVVRQGLDIDVIMITGHGTIESAVECIKLGAYDFITKPFVPHHVKQVVGRAVENRRLRAERDRLAAQKIVGLEAIATEKSRLKAVINSMGEGVLISNREMGIILCNPAFTVLMGLSEHCVLGSSMDDHPQLAPLNRVAAALLQGDAEVTTLVEELDLSRAEGRFLRVSVSKVMGERSGLLGLVLVLRDITQFKNLERRKAEFISMVTHELRSPVGVVDTQLKVMSKGLAGEMTNKQVQMFSRMQARISGLLELINNLLDLSKIEAQSFVQQKRPADLNQVAAEVAAMMEPQAADQGISLALTTDPELPEAVMDPDSMKEVVTNLVSNALRYTPAGGRVTISTSRDASFVNLAVADTGYGIDDKDLDRIFEKFYRVKNDQTRHIVGTGLGLPIVKAIVDDHLGKVEVASRPGQGSIFTVRLPLPV